MCRVSYLSKCAACPRIYSYTSTGNNISGLSYYIDVHPMNFSTTKNEMAGHVCRVCAGTILYCLEHPDFSTVVADVSKLHIECGLIEEDLHDSFNAFCFVCRRITMSVPVDVTKSAQVCYLRAQVTWFQKLLSYGLVVRAIPRHGSIEIEPGVCHDGPQVVVPVVVVTAIEPGTVIPGMMTSIAMPVT
jgi:hypothetical protein